MKLVDCPSCFSSSSSDETYLSDNKNSSQKFVKYAQKNLRKFSKSLFGNTMMMSTTTSTSSTSQNPKHYISTTARKKLKTKTKLYNDNNEFGDTAPAYNNYKQFNNRKCQLERKHKVKKRDLVKSGGGGSGGGRVPIVIIKGIGTHLNFNLIN